MKRLSQAVQREDGHAQPFAGALIGAVGAILLAIGAANGTGALAIAGGITLAVGLFATLVIQHMSIDYDVYGRIEKLEKK